MFIGGSSVGTPTHHNNSNHGSPTFGESAWHPHHPTPSPKPSPASTPTKASQPSAVALFDFDAENPAELSFKVKQAMITLQEMAVFNA